MKVVKIRKGLVEKAKCEGSNVDPEFIRCLELTYEAGLSTKLLASVLGFSIQTIYAWVNQGVTLKPSVLSRAIAYNEITQYLLDKKIMPLKIGVSELPIFTYMSGVLLTPVDKSDDIREIISKRLFSINQ